MKLINEIIKQEIESLLLENKQYPPIPNIVYHGQPPTYDNKGNRSEPIKFSKFDQNKKRFLKDQHYGFYLTPYRNLAIDYAEGGNLYVCNVNLKNPYYYEYMFGYSNDGLIKAPNFLTKNDVNILNKNGYDSVVTLSPMYEIEQVIPLKSEQIKIVEVIDL